MPFFFPRTHTHNVWTKCKGIYLALNPVICLLGQSAKCTSFLPQFSLSICSCELSLGQRETMSTPDCCPLVAIRQKLEWPEPPAVDYRHLGRGKVLARSIWILFNSQSFVCRKKNDYLSKKSMPIFQIHLDTIVMNQTQSHFKALLNL